MYADHLFVKLFGCATFVYELPSRIPAMSQLMEKLAKVSDQIESLGSRLTELTSENEQLKTQLADALHQLNHKERRLTELGEKQKLIMLARSLPSDESRKDVKLKINDMVREIDKCIALLNS